MRCFGATKESVIHTLHPFRKQAGVIVFESGFNAPNNGRLGQSEIWQFPQPGENVDHRVIIGASDGTRTRDLLRDQAGVLTN